MCTQRKFLAVVVASLAWSGAGVLPHTVRAQEPENRARAVNYGRPFKSHTRSAFLPLPPGAIEPAGWLRDWALSARDGYTGHMDEVHPDFQKAWAVDYTMTGDRLSFWDKGAWPYEGGGYWFDGMIKLGYALHDDALLRQAKSRLDVVVSRMHENGIVFMWWLDKNKPDDVAAAEKELGGEAQGWPIWANGLLGRSLSAYYAGSGDARVLRALELAYGENGSWTHVAWAPSNLWAAFEAYTWTGNKEIARALTDVFARNVVQAPDRNASLYASWCNRLPDETIPAYVQQDHGVHFNEGVNAWAAGYLWTGDARFLQVPVRWYDVIERGDDGMQPHGVPVADENNGPTGSFRGTETCDVAAYMWSQITLLRVAGQGRMGDRIERAFFNAGPAVATRDFNEHVYFQSPNRIDKDLPSAGQFAYRRAHHPLCCVAALNRIVPNYITNMWLATYDNGLAAVEYGPCKVSALVADRVPLELVCRTEYPFNDCIDIDVKPEREAVFALSFRIPGWCAAPEIALNASAYNAAADGNGFVRVERRWKPGDRIRLRFPMTVRVKLGHDNSAKDTPYATVSYGPLLFALAIPDTNDANTPAATARWNYALDGSSAAPNLGITVERAPMPEKWGWQLASPLRLRVRACSFDWTRALRKTLPVGPAASVDASPYQPEAIMTLLPAEPVAAQSTPEDISLIPYGCTKFRVSMFPITERAFKLLQSGALPAQPSAPGAQVQERRELEGGLVREKLLLPGWDASDPVPAIALYPRSAVRAPVVFLFHWFQGSKEVMEPWAHELASKGFFALAVDCHFHGERKVEGMFARPDLPALGEEFSVFVHQSSIAHTARDFPVILAALAERREIDPARVGVAGISMGAALALVLAWQDSRITAVASLVGAADFWWDVTKLAPGAEQDAKRDGYSARVRRLVESIDPRPRLEKYAPKAVFMANGQRDHFIAIDSMRRIADDLRRRYAATPERFTFLEEDVGHEATDSMRTQANAWLARFLGEAVKKP